jgi:hypothetical protein
MLAQNSKNKLILRMLEIEKELKQYPEKKQELDRELIKVCQSYSKSRRLSER